MFQGTKFWHILWPLLTNLENHFNSNLNRKSTVHKKLLRVIISVVISRSSFLSSSTILSGFDSISCRIFSISEVLVSDLHLSLLKSLCSDAFYKECIPLQPIRGVWAPQNSWWEKEWEMISLNSTSQILGCAFKPLRAGDCVLATLALICVV